MWWWTRLPIFASRVAKLPAAALIDGIYLWAWPSFARWASPAALALGIMIGGIHPGYRWVFTESLPLLLCLVALGVLSGHLGTLFLTGFVVADACLLHNFLWSPQPVMRSIGLAGALVIQFALLASVLMLLPIIAKSLLAPFVKSGYAKYLRLPIALVGHVLITAGLTYCWVNSVPLLIRPMFTWQGNIPSVAAMSALQKNGGYVVVVAAAASLLRMVLQLWTGFRSHGNEHIDTIGLKAGDLSFVRAISERLPVVVRVALSSSGTAFIFGGMYSQWTDAFIIFVLVAILNAIRYQIIPTPLKYWSDTMDRIPLLIRLLAGVGLVYIIGSQVLTIEMRSTNTFRPFIIITGLSFVVFFLLNPSLAGPFSKEESRQ
jgi:hypothetical protein